MNKFIVLICNAVNKIVPKLVKHAYTKYPPYIVKLPVTKKYFWCRRYAVGGIALFRHANINVALLLKIIIINSIITTNYELNRLCQNTQIHLHRFWLIAYWPNHICCNNNNTRLEMVSMMLLLAHNICTLNY